MGNERLCLLEIQGGLGECPGQCSSAGDAVVFKWPRSLVKLGSQTPGMPVHPHIGRNGLGASSAQRAIALPSALSVDLENVLYCIISFLVFLGKCLWRSAEESRVYYNLLA